MGLPSSKNLVSQGAHKKQCPVSDSSTCQASSSAFNAANCFSVCDISWWDGPWLAMAMAQNCVVQIVSKNVAFWGSEILKDPFLGDVDHDFGAILIIFPCSLNLSHLQSSFQRYRWNHAAVPERDHPSRASELPWMVPFCHSLIICTAALFDHHHWASEGSKERCNGSITVLILTEIQRNSQQNHHGNVRHISLSLYSSQNMYPLVNVYITMENRKITIFHGKIHYKWL